MTIIERARLCVATRPPAIEGQAGNSTTFSVASMLVWGFGLEPDEALPLMMEYNQRCEPPWAVRELQRMLTNVKHRAHTEARGYMVQDSRAERGDVPKLEEQPKRKKRASFDLERLKRAQAAGLPVDLSGWRAWLSARCAADPRQVTAEQFLDALYEPGEKLLVFLKMWANQGDYGRWVGKGTYKLGQSPGERPQLVEALPQGSPEGMTWLMQPIDASWHPVVKPNRVEMSRRTKKSVTRWPYILLESDKAPHELWLNCMVRARIRIVAIIASGGRSLHALVRLNKDTEAELLEEVKDPDNEELLTLLGCDPQAMHGMVYPRLPNTLRDGKRMTKLDSQGNKVMHNGRPVMHFVPFKHGTTKQALLYFNPEPECGRSISEGLIYERE